VAFDGFGEISFNLGRVGADAGDACFPDRGEGFVDLLHHYSDEACEFTKLAGQERPAKFNSRKLGQAGA
jgi:hypothetical protein